MWVVMVALLAAAAADEAGPLRCRHARCRYIGRFQFDEHRYQVDDNEIWVMYGTPGAYLRIQCVGDTVLESPAMPRADPAMSAWKLNIANCKLPPTSLERTLANLNISTVFEVSELRGNLTIENLPPSFLLTAEHFVGFERLVSLHIYSENTAPTRAERHFLTPLQNLRSLRLQHVTLPLEELDAPRPELRALVLSHTGIEHLPEALYSSPSLLEIKVESARALDAVAIPPRLVSLELVSPATTLRVESVPSLRELRLTAWTEPHPPPLTHCRLRKLYLTSPAVTSLPHGWLANCSKLEELVVEKAQNLTTLPHRLFGDCLFSLSLIAFTEGALESLSEGQFDNATCVLFTLQLNGNRLQTIPSGTLPSSLEKLDLSSNDLDSGVLEVVKMVHFRLTELNLSGNPRLGDLCDKNGNSPLMTSLKQLRLSKTNVSRICRDWREDMTQLETLDLRDTNITILTLQDLQYNRTVRGEVLLGAPVASVRVSRRQYSGSGPARGSALAAVRLDAELACDCAMYWTRRMLDRSPYMLDHVSELRCAHGRPLRSLPPSEMVCPLPSCGLPPACACAARPDDDPTVGRSLVRADCAGGALTSPPHPPHTTTLYDMQLSYNDITELQPDDLYNVKSLDLRYNKIKRVDEATATVLGRLPGVLRLGGNPLACDCSAAPLLQALHSRAPGATDFINATCDDGAPLETAFVVGCPPSVTWLVIMMTVTFVTFVLIMVYLSSRERRFFVKAVLHRWGCWYKNIGEELPYDAFITFSHKDEGVVRELVARLEPPYRLCLHYRDWIPGRFITEQIVESVQFSQRTVALVSRHFLSSTWTRAEFREAHTAAMMDDRPRLVVVLLEDPAELELDEQLKRYVATHTYVRWGDPWFWDKLAVALPRPRRPPDPPADHDTPRLPSVVQTVSSGSVDGRGAMELALCGGDSDSQRCNPTISDPHPET